MAFVLRDTSLASLWAMLRRVQPGWAIAALGAHVVMMAVSVWRWNLLLRAQHVEVPTRDAVRVVLGRVLLQQLPAQQHRRRRRAHRRHLEAGRIEDAGDHRGPGRSAARPLRAADRGGDRRRRGHARSASRCRAAGGCEVAALAAAAVAIPVFAIPRLLDGAAGAGARPRASVGAANARRCSRTPSPASAPGHRRWSARWPARSSSRW